MSDKLSVRPQQNTIEHMENNVHRDCGVECGFDKSCSEESPVLPVEGAELVDETVRGNIGGDVGEPTASVEQEVERIKTLPTYQPTKMNMMNVV